MSVTSGWGRLTWNQANWNEATTLKTGWGAQSWSGEGGWGDLSDQTISLTGIKASPCDNVISKLVGVIITSGISTVPILNDADIPVKEIV